MVKLTIFLLQQVILIISTKINSFINTPHPTSISLLCLTSPTHPDTQTHLSSPSPPEPPQSPPPPSSSPLPPTFRLIYEDSYHTATQRTSFCSRQDIEIFSLVPYYSFTCLEVVVLVFVIFPDTYSPSLNFTFEGFSPICCLCTNRGEFKPADGYFCRLEYLALIFTKNFRMTGSSLMSKFPKFGCCLAYLSSKKKQG